MDDLPTEAEQLREQMQLVPPREPGEKLRPIDEATILELAAAGKSQTEIAEIVGCHQSTVSRTLAEWADSRGLARKFAEAKSLEMMQRFVKDASPAEILKMQQKLDVIRDDKVQGSTNGVTVMIGLQSTDEQRQAMVPTVVIEQVRQLEERKPSFETATLATPGDVTA